MPPLSSRCTIATELARSGPSTGPNTPTGLMTQSSRLPPSRARKSHAARAASVFDLMYGATSSPVTFVQIVSSNGASCGG